MIFKVCLSKSVNHFGMFVFLLYLYVDFYIYESYVFYESILCFEISVLFFLTI